MKKPAKKKVPSNKKIVLSAQTFRRYVTPNQLARALKVARSAVDNAIKRFKKAHPDAKFEVKEIRTGKRGPMSKAVRIAGMK